MRAWARVDGVEYLYTRSLYIYIYIRTNTLATGRVYAGRGRCTRTLRRRHDRPLARACACVCVHIGFEDCIFHGPMKTSLNTSLTIVCVRTYTRVRVCMYLMYVHTYTCCVQRARTPPPPNLRAPRRRCARHTRVLCVLRTRGGSVKNPNRITPVL